MRNTKKYFLFVATLVYQILTQFDSVTAQPPSKPSGPGKMLMTDIADWVSQDRIEKDLLEKVKKISFRSSFCPRKLTAVKISADINQAFLREEDVSLESDNKHYKCIVDLTLRQRWKNPRLAFDNSAHPELEYVTLNSPSGVWTPDIYFPGEIHRASTTNLGPENFTALWIYPTGDVFYSARLFLQFLTQTDDSGFRCTIPLEAYRCSTKKLVLMWDDKDPVRALERVGGNSIVMDSSIQAKYYKKSVAKIVAGKAEIPVRSFGGMGNFSQLFSSFNFEFSHL